MSEAIIIALITGGLAVVSNVIVVIFNSSKTLLRIDILEKKVEKHNNYMERLLQAEVHIQEMKEDIDEIKEKL